MGPMNVSMQPIRRPNGDAIVTIHGRLLFVINRTNGGYFKSVRAFPMVQFFFERRGGNFLGVRKRCKRGLYPMVFFRRHFGSFRVLDRWVRYARVLRDDEINESFFRRGHRVSYRPLCRYR